MRFRPRYSLLTLLVVTALVAGGVKLWYGPHHVIERPTPEEEVEYTYTRDWRGEKIVHGAKILRHFRTNRTLGYVEIIYYLHGIKTKQEQEVLALPLGNQGGSRYYRSKPPPLPPADEAAFQAAIAQEIAMIQAAGFCPGVARYENLEDDTPPVAEGMLDSATAE